MVRSESPSGSSGTKGHVLFTHEADIDVRYARFMHLGRTTTAPEHHATNHTGRSSLHIHHMMGPQVTPANGYQVTLIGNAVDGGSVPPDRQWGVTIHNSHYGLIQDNVAYNIKVPNSKGADPSTTGE